MLSGILQQDGVQDCLMNIKVGKRIKETATINKHYVSVRCHRRPRSRRLNRVWTFWYWKTH